MKYFDKAKADNNVNLLTYVARVHETARNVKQLWRSIVKPPGRSFTNELFIFNFT